MELLTDRIKKYIDSLEFSKVKSLISRLAKEDIEQFELDESVCKKILFEKITDGYDEYVVNCIKPGIATIELINSQSDILPESFKFGKPDSEVNMAYQLYRNLKFFTLKEIVDFFLSKGINIIYLHHFINLFEVENIMMNLIENGFIINIKQTLNLVDLQYNLRIIKDLYGNYMNHEMLYEYDSSKNVKKMDVTMRNIRRNRRMKSSIQHKTDSFNVKINSLLDQIENASKDKTMSDQLIKILLNAIREKNSPAKQKFKEYFDSLLEFHTAEEIRIHFKSFFYILFENTEYGLRTEDKFNIEVMPTGKYDGSYSKYYNTRLKTLIGLG